MASSRGSTRAGTKTWTPPGASFDQYRADLENPPLLVACDTERIEIHGLLPNEVASELFEATKGKPELFEQLVRDLLAKMAERGYFGVDRIPHVDGSLFDAGSTLALTAPELEFLASAAKLDWSAIDSSIVGTLFERGLDPDQRRNAARALGGVDR